MMGKTLKQLNVYNAYGVNVIEIRRIAKQGAALRKVEQFALADVELQTETCFTSAVRPNVLTCSLPKMPCCRKNRMRPLPD